MKLILAVLLITFLLPEVKANENRDARARLLDLLSETFRTVDPVEFSKECRRTDQYSIRYCQQNFYPQLQAMNEASRLLSLISNESRSAADAIQSMDCLTPGVQDLNDIEELLARVNTPRDCEELAPGESKLPGFGNYLLRRGSDGNYEVVLNIRFAGGDGTTMQNHLNRCFEPYVQYLRSPPSGGYPRGNTMSLRVVTPEEAEREFRPAERPRMNTVNIVSPTRVNENGITEAYRADAANFPSNMDCGTGIHELLHHLGLLDEYHEVVSQYPCRVVPTMNTVMGTHERALKDTIPESRLCLCTTAACRNVVRGSTAQSANFRSILSQEEPWATLHPRIPEFCQPVPVPASTAMTDPEKATVVNNYENGVLVFEHRKVNLSGSTPRLERTQFTCNCAGNDRCQRYIENALPRLRSSPGRKYCPEGMNSDTARAAREGETTSVEGNGLRIVTTPTMPSLLAPNHFARILHGYCPTGPSADYMSCVSFAYNSGSLESCNTETRKKCLNDSFFLGTSNQ